MHVQLNLRMVDVSCVTPSPPWVIFTPVFYRPLKKIFTFGVSEIIVLNLPMKERNKNWIMKRLLRGLLQLRNFLTGEPTQNGRSPDQYIRESFIHWCGPALIYRCADYFYLHLFALHMIYTVAIATTCLKKGNRKNKMQHDPPKGQKGGDIHLLLTRWRCVSSFCRTKITMKMWLFGLMCSSVNVTVQNMTQEIANKIILLRKNRFICVSCPSGARKCNNVVVAKPRMFVISDSWMYDWHFTFRSRFQYIYAVWRLNKQYWYEICNLMCFHYSKMMLGMLQAIDCTTLREFQWFVRNL